MRSRLGHFSTEIVQALVRTALDRICARRAKLSPNQLDRLQQDEAQWTTHLATLRRRCDSCGQMYQASTCPHCGGAGVRPTHLW